MILTYENLWEYSWATWDTSHWLPIQLHIKEGITELAENCIPDNWSWTGNESYAGQIGVLILPSTLRKINGSPFGGRFTPEYIRFRNPIDTGAWYDFPQGAFWCGKWAGGKPGDYGVPVDGIQPDNWQSYFHWHTSLNQACSQKWPANKDYPQPKLTDPAKNTVLTQQNLYDNAVYEGWDNVGKLTILEGVVEVAQNAIPSSGYRNGYQYFGIESIFFPPSVKQIGPYVTGGRFFPSKIYFAFPPPTQKVQQYGYVKFADNAFKALPTWKKWKGLKVSDVYCVLGDKATQLLRDYISKNFPNAFEK